MRKLLDKHEVNERINGWWLEFDKMPSSTDTEIESRDYMRNKLQAEEKKLRDQLRLQDEIVNNAWAACWFINPQNPLAASTQLLAMSDACASVVRGSGPDFRITAKKAYEAATAPIGEVAIVEK